MTLIEVFFCRHGLTEENVKGIFQGQMHGTLTSHGKRQAKSVGKGLKESILDGKRVDLILASDLNRTMRSTAEIAEYIHAPIVEEPLLRERHYGELQGTVRKKGVSLRELDSHHPEIQGKNVEPFSDLGQRARKVIEKILSLHAKTIVCVGHASMNNYILNFLRKEKLGSVNYHQSHGDVFKVVLGEKGELKDAEVYRFTFDENGDATKITKEKL